MTPYILIALLALVVSLALVTASDSNPGPDVKTSSTHQRALPGRLLDRIQDARQQTWECENSLALARTKASSRPIGSTAYARWVLKLWTERAHAVCRVARHLQKAGVLRQVVDPCLAGIVQRENARWDPTIDYGWGHGNVHEAYGIPQANPGTKMASAGAEWRTSAVVQLIWMAGYTRARYGSSCGALAKRKSQGWY